MTNKKEDRIPAGIERIFRDAVACRYCFDALGLNLKAALIDVAQPRWIGEDYWRSARRTVIVLINPASGNGAHDEANEKFRGLISAYGERSGTISAVFDYQKSEIPRWGSKKFSDLYLHGFELHLPEIALANIAWCAEAHNRYPEPMLSVCFRKHTMPLLKALEPQFVILGGSKVHPFAGQIRAACPGAKVIEVLHYAHRKGDVANQNEITRVKEILKADQGS